MNSTTGTAFFFGAGTVRVVEDRTVHVSTEAGDLRATVALAYPYRPARGDVVLVIGDEPFYVVGVLQARGKTSLDVLGDLEIRAGGRLKLKGERGVDIEGDRVTLRADRLETVARAVFERVTDSYRWIKGVLHTSAERIRTIVKGSSTLHAHRIVEQAKRDVVIDGDRIQLG